MGQLQDMFETELDRLPRIACRKLVTEKLQTLGIDDDGLIETVVSHILDGATLEVDEESPIARLIFSEADGVRAGEISDALVGSIGPLLEDLSDISAVHMLEGFRAAWPERESDDRAEVDAFTSRLEDRWRKPLSGLRLLLQLSRDLGVQFHQDHIKSRLKRDRYRNEALGRLHNRACQVTAEIILLLQNGFPEGAYARWRTLLELMVSAVLIVEGGDPLAERFLAYEAVERKRTMDEHNRCAALSGGRPVGSRETRAIERGFERVKLRHGDAIKESYGWVAGQLGLPTRPNFRQMQDLAGSTPFRIYYKLASFGVHASPQANATLSLMDREIWIAGATNAGLEQSGANTSNVLVRLTTLLFGADWDLDKIALARCLLKLSDETQIAFHSVARKLERDELKCRKDLERDALRLVDRPGPVRKIQIKRR